MADIKTINGYQLADLKARSDIDVLRDSIKDNYGYVSGANGKLYRITVDESGNLLLNEAENEIKSNLVTDGLIHHYKVVDGTLTDVVTGTVIEDGVEYNGETFKTSIELLNERNEGSVEYVGSRAVQPVLGSANIKITTSSVSNVSVGVSVKESGYVNNIYYGILEYYQSHNYSRFADEKNVSYIFVDKNAKSAPVLLGFDNTIRRDKVVKASTDKFTFGFYYDVTKDGVENKKRSLNGTIHFNSNSNYNITSDNGLKINGGNNLYVYEYRVYDRKLTDDEIIQNSIYDATHYSVVESYEIEKHVDGFENFGANPRMKAIGSVVPNKPVGSEIEVGSYTDRSGNDYSIRSFSSYPEPPRTENVFEGIKFISVPEKLYTFRKYSACAYPYPFNGASLETNAGKFHVMYSTSDPEVCACVDGVLIPKKKGTVTITARLAGTQNIKDQFTVDVEVYNDSCSDAETLYVPENYMYGFHALNSKSPVSCATAMFHIIKAAGEQGFKRVVFPKKEYTIYPLFSEGDETRKYCCVVPSNMVIDFNGSTITIAENPYCLRETRVDYQIFAFTDKCRFSSIKNAVFYGERKFNTSRPESDYQDHCGIVLMNDCFMCGTDNTEFHDTVGFYYMMTTAGQGDWYGGIRDPNANLNSELPRRGMIDKAEFELGGFDESGNKVSASGYIRTTAMHHIGWNPEDLREFCFGTMGDHYYAVNSRWLRVFWYDENKNLLNSGGTLYFQFSRYELPEGATYFKLVAYQDAIPTKNYGEDQCALRLYPFKHAFHCYAKNLVSINPHGWAMTITGGQQNYVGDAVLERTRRYSYYSVDLEDNYITTNGQVFDNVVGAGINMYGGYGHAVLSYFGFSSYNTLNFSYDAECLRVMNCCANKMNKSAKTDNVFRGNKVTTVTSGTIKGSLIETDASSPDLVTL